MKKNTVLTWSFVIALGGFLFGFDTAVISGAEKAVQEYWALTAIEHGITMAIALVGTVVGSFIGAYPSDRFGRKKTLFIVAALYFFSALGTAFTNDWPVFILFRLLGGIGVGVSSVTAPVYISEIAPPASRGRLVGLFQFNVVLGILIAYLSNYLIGLGGETSWRWMLGVQAFPAFVFYGLIFMLPESPRWLLLKRNDREGAAKVLQKINPKHYLQDIEAILRSAGPEPGSSTASLFNRSYRYPVMLAILFAVFNQASGINAIIYYSPRVFEMAGLGAQSSLLSSVGIGLVNFIFTLGAINIMDKIGRKKLMMIGSFGLFASLSLVAYSFYAHLYDGYMVVISLFVFIAFFASSQGAVIWVFIAEIFPNEIRAKGQMLGSLTHWAMATLITFCFPIFSKWAGGGPTFTVFAVCMLLQLLFVVKLMPETNGKSLEELSSNISVH